MSDKTLNFSEKFSEVRKHFGFTQLALSNKLGVSPSAVGFIEQGKSKSPSAEVLSAMSSNLGVSLEWLLNDKGPMLLADAEAQKKSAYIPRTDAHPVGLLSEIPVIALRHVSFKARASFDYAQLQRYKVEDGNLFDTLLFRLPPGRTEEDYKDALVFDIEGDSMEPSLRDGQQVIAWPVSESKWEHLHNTICVVDYDDTVTVKAILNNDLNNRDGLVLHATGGRGGEFTVSRNLIHSIWEVREFYGVVPVRLVA